MSRNKANSLRARDFSAPPTPEMDDFMENDDDGEVDNELAALLANMTASGSSGEVKVYAMKAHDGRAMVWLFSFAPGEYTYSQLLEHVRDNYGAGDYCIKVHGGISNRLLQTEKVSVGAPIRKPQPAGESQPDSVLAFMREQAAMQQTMLMGLMQALAGRPAPVAPEGLSVADTLALLNATKGGGDAKEVMGLIMQGIELGKQVSGNAPDDEGGFMGALKMLAPALAGMATQPAAPLPRRPRIAPPAVQGSPSEQPLTPQAPPHKAPDSNQQELQILLKMLVRAAVQHAEPAIYAEVVIDQVGTEAAGQLTQPAVFEQIIHATPGAADHLSWFHELREEIATMLSDDAAGVDLHGHLPGGDGFEDFPDDAISEGGELD